MRVLRVLVALLTGCAALLAPALAPAAHAVEPAALVRITLTAMTPDLPRRDGKVTLQGRVQNVTEERLYRLQAILWRDQAPITTAEGVQQALDSDSNVPIGARRTPYYQDLYTPAKPYLEPGATATFSITAPVEDLQLAPTDGLYLIGVQVLQNGNLTAVGRARTFAPVLVERPKASLRLTSLVVLASRPSQLRRGVLSDEHLAEEVRPGGRLAQLLAAADSAEASFAVDPALVDELTTMRAGYTVQGAEGVTPGRGQADATAWLQRFEQVRTTRDGFRLLYGSPDIAALVRDRQASLLQDAMAAGRRVEATAALPLLVLPGDGFADEATLRAAALLEPAAVVLSDSSAVSGVGPWLAGPGGTRVVRFSGSASGSASAGGPGPDPRNTRVQVRQRVLADTWVQASTATGNETRGRVRLVTATNQIQGDDPGVEAPWMNRTTLSALLRGTPTPWDGELSYPDQAREAELTPGQLGTLRRFAASWSTYAELLVDNKVLLADGEEAVARAASVGWRGQEPLRSPFLQTQQAALDTTLLDRLRISTNPRVSTVAREGVAFPITIENQLPVDAENPQANAVRLRLVFVSENRQRLTIAPIETQSVRAGDSYLAEARVTAKANGTVVVRAQLQTADGTPVGRPRTIAVRVTQNGTTGWAIAAAALVFFGGGTALRIRQVNRTRARTTPAAPDPASALTSAPPPDAPAAGLAAAHRPRDPGHD